MNINPKSRRLVAGAIAGLSMVGCALSPKVQGPATGDGMPEPVNTLPVVERYARCQLAESPPTEGCAGFPDDRDPLVLAERNQRRAQEAMEAIYGINASEYQARMAGRYLIRMGTDANTCFRDLNTPQRLNALLDQVDQIASFLSDYHARVFGVPSASVLAPTVVEICSTRRGPEPLYWTGPNTLQIRMPSDSLQRDSSSKSSLLSSWRIAQIWRRGEHHVEELQLFSRPVDLRSIWPVIDPAGTIRTGLRKQIVSSSGELQARIQSVARELNRLAAQGVPKAQLQGTAAELITAETGIPKEQVVGVLSDWDPADALRAWQAAAADPEVLASISEDLGAAIRPCSPRRETEEKKRLYGLVVVDNVHDIYICVGSQDGAEQDLPASEDRTLRRDITAVGLFVVSTGDVVHVEASLQDRIHTLLERTRSVARRTFLRAMSGTDSVAF